MLSFLSLSGLRPKTSSLLPATHAPAIDSVPLDFFLLLSSFRLVPGVLLPHCAYPPISWACVSFGPLQSVQTSTVNSALFTTAFTLLTYLSHLSYCASFQSLENPNCLVISSRGRTQPGLILACTIVFPITQLKQLGYSLFEIFLNFKKYDN